MYSDSKKDIQIHQAMYSDNMRPYSDMCSLIRICGVLFGYEEQGKRAKFEYGRSYSDV